MSNDMRLEKQLRDAVQKHAERTFEALKRENEARRQLKIAERKIRELKRDVGRLKDELRRKNRRG